MIIAQDKSFNAGHSTFTLVKSIFDSFTSDGDKIVTYTLYHNSCPIWYGTSKDEGMQEFNRITIPAW